MKGIKVELKNAEKAKNIIIKSDLLEKGCRIEKQKNSIIFPVKDEIGNKVIFRLKGIGASMVKHKFESFCIITSYKELLKSRLSENENEILPSSFDTLGNIIIIEIPKELQKKEKMIGEALLKTHKSIKTVLKKAGIHKGAFRTQKMSVIAGEKKKETTYIENSVRLKLDVEKVYFSPRLSTERARINSLVKPGEEVLVMFSGCGPYVFNIAKNTEASHVHGIEINPIGHKYALINKELNHAINTTLIKGNVSKVVPKLKQKFDRILMPLPKSAEDFLDTALMASKKGTIIHFYDFLHEKDVPKKAIEKIEKACKKAKRKYKVLNYVKCGQHSPRTFRICVDVKILN